MLHLTLFVMDHNGTRSDFIVLALTMKPRCNPALHCQINEILKRYMHLRMV